MLPTRNSLTSSGFTPDRSTAALPSSTGETSAKAPQKLAKRPDAVGEVDFLEHCFIAKCVLIGSSNYFFNAGPKRSTSSFQSAMILAFVFRAL
jgi:hypothetical protein